MLVFEISPQLSDGKITVAGTYIDLRICSSTYCIVSAKCERQRSFMRRFLLHRQPDKLDGRTHMQFLPRLIPLPRTIGCSTFDLPERRNYMECVRMSSL
jgi:hypothetical protein